VAQLAGSEARVNPAGNFDDEKTVVSRRLPFKRATHWRIFLTCWLFYLLHFSPFVTREVYLTMALAERGTIQVPEYVDLHADLFTIPGRGAYAGTNPGTSFLAAVPYWLALPVINRLAPVRPRPPEEVSGTQYREDRRNRLKFYQKVRERGLDVRLGVAALLTSGFFMAPLTALSAVLVFRLLGWMGMREKAAVWMALLYALGTPVFLRAGTLSLNLLTGLLGLAAFALIWWPSQRRPDREHWRYLAAGALGGYAVATDFTGAITLLAVGFYALMRQLSDKPVAAAIRGTSWAVAGAIPPGLFLMWYQWHAFGNPWLPVQFHMPKQIFVGYPSEHGFGWPLPAALWGILFDAQYGLLIFAPLFALALFHPVLQWRRESRLPGTFAAAAWFHFFALWLFCSCVHYTVRHQWQDGVRYIVPAMIPLFLLAADVLVRLPRWASLPLIGFQFIVSWSVAMVRVHPYESMARVLTQGVQYPWLTTLSNAALQYFPPLADPASLWSRGLPWAVWLGLAVWVVLIWTVGGRKSPGATGVM
jgi:hypothetical protein